MDISVSVSSIYIFCFLSKLIKIYIFCFLSKLFQALNSEYHLSVELFNPSGSSTFKTPNNGKHYFKFPEVDGTFHEIGDFQLCVSSRQVRQSVQVGNI